MSAGGPRSAQPVPLGRQTRSEAERRRSWVTIVFRFVGVDRTYGVAGGQPADVWA